MTGMNTWNLRDDILKRTHQWYWVMAFVLAGSVLGWVWNEIWPSPYRASIELYVGLNGYRSEQDQYAASLAEQSFGLVDDYKNWQMSQLNEFALSDQVLDETLRQLRSQDASWDEVSTLEFRKMASVLWRNVGEWLFVVEMDNPERAVQAVEIWIGVILDQVNQAIDHARNVVALDAQMANIVETRIEYELRQDALDYVKGRFQYWLDRLEAASDDQNIPTVDHWDILGLGSQAASWDPAWKRVLDAAPNLGSVKEVYQEWIEAVLSIIDAELAVMPGKIAMLDDDLALVERDYQLETANSYGFASTLVVEKLNNDPPVLEQVGHPGTLVLVGGLIGLLIWVGYLGFRISRDLLE